MSSSSGAKLSRPITPYEVALVGVVVAYFLSVVVLRELVHPEASAPLISLSAISIACVSAFVPYVALRLWIGPRIDKRDAREALKAGDRRKAMGMLSAAHNAAMQSLANTTRWWHHFLAGIGGIVYGLLLVAVIKRFLA
jgi:hypothetical protein